jgi:hypothetical protein
MVFSFAELDDDTCMKVPGIGDFNSLYVQEIKNMRRLATFACFCLRRMNYWAGTVW